MAEKVRLKLRYNEVCALGQFIQFALTRLDGKNEWHHLLGYVLQGILKKKLAPAMIYPKAEIRLQFKRDESTAIKIASNLIDLVELDNYVAAVMIDLSTKLK